MTSEHQARLEQVRRDVAAVNAAKACGCVPDEPCALHRDLGDLPDWEGRARAAEGKLAALRERCDGLRLVLVADVLAIIGGEQEVNKLNRTEPS